MSMGSLEWVPARTRSDLLADPVATAVGALEADDVRVAEIDPGLSDTAVFCERYGVRMDESANCVIVSGRRNGQVRHAACLVLAAARIDVNGVVRKWLDVRKVSFAPQEEAVSLTGMEYGGITPLGLPDDWPVLVDEAVAAHPGVVIGSGVRRSKLAVSGALLGGLKGAEVLRLAG
ncbi:YbaK/EbsC family protein [Microtetraspora sp. NBRC 13810]|uniref:YbaK/EbsC family protein n=1 Tax=Microtetraspora sp. NBRC 13810 TaxID=3030990 RepID=UPI0025558D7B|nr:YbaK/EbsC family protein [Microtetraspora sp. NBRC 13810]